MQALHTFAFYFVLQRNCMHLINYCFTYHGNGRTESFRPMLQTFFLFSERTVTENFFVSSSTLMVGQAVKKPYLAGKPNICKQRGGDSLSNDVIWLNERIKRTNRDSERKRKNCGRTDSRKIIFLPIPTPQGGSMDIARPDNKGLHYIIDMQTAKTVTAWSLLILMAHIGWPPS